LALMMNKVLKSMKLKLENSKGANYG
jgi:hypothetical protein